jgi:hypothetical protein
MLFLQEGLNEISKSAAFKDFKVLYFFCLYEVGKKQFFIIFFFTFKLMSG